MQHVNSAAFVPANAGDRKAFALDLYAAAMAAPDRANWRSVAEALRAALPASRGKAKPATAWADYVPGRKCVFQSVAVRFADGRAFMVSAASDPGKPLNIGRAIRTAVAFYRSKVFTAIGRPQPCEFASTRTRWDAAVNVPAFTHVSLVETNAPFDAAEASEITAELRAGVWSYSPSDASSLLATEIAEIGARCPWLDEFELVRAAIRESYTAAWRRQYLAAELAPRAEHAARLAAYDVAQAAARVARDTADGPARCEAWAAAVAADLPEFVELELTGTVEAEAGAPVEAMPEAVEAIAPVEAIEPAPPVEAIPDDAGDVDTGEAWNPTPATHPYVAICRSRSAREKLFTALLDGTYPAELSTDARGGAWRLSVEDAATARRIARCDVEFHPAA